MSANRLSRWTLPNVDYADIENKDQVLRANINKNGGFVPSEVKSDLASKLVLKVLK